MTGSALYAAISGMKSQQIKLDVIANNVANLNTFGYKSSRVAFSDLLSQSLRAASAPQAGRGGTNPVQVGVGVQLASIDTIIIQGSIQTTGNLTDLAINGEGYFVVYDGTSLAYTRAGNFTLDADGALITPDGSRVQGWTSLDNSGQFIDASTTVNDVTVNFGEKIPGRATTTIDYRSNLNASSFTFGSAELRAPGSTGFTIASGIAVPIASYTGSQMSGFPLADATTGELNLNGQEIDLDFTAAGFDWGPPLPSAIEVAQFVADQINLQSTTIYARVGSNGNLILQNLFGGEGNDIIIQTTDALYLADLGLVTGTFTAPVADSSLAGLHTITIQESTSATDTTTIPVAAGTIGPGSFDIMGTAGAVTISFSATDSANTSAQNAQIIADAINTENSTNPDFFISAVANANGTITLTSDLPGYNNQIIVSDAGPSQLHLDTLGMIDGSGNYVVDNGTDASISNSFESDDGLVSWVRTFTDAAPFGTPSELANLELLVLGDNPPLPLIPGVTLTAESLSPGQATIVTHDAFEHQTNITVYDSLSNAHQLNITFRHIGSNEWEWTASLPDEPQYTLQNANGTISFGSNGMTTAANPNVPIIFTPTGADTMSIFPVFDGSGDPIAGVTQYSAPSTTAAESQDGYSMGTLQAFGFDTSGTLQGVYSNGLTRPLARLALAVFSNPAGLQRAGRNNWVSTSNSGLARYVAPRTGGSGEILGGSLEQSNVDAATEFSELIIAQRSFQANSRIITAQDSILQEVVNLVR